MSDNQELTTSILLDLDKVVGSGSDQQTFLAHIEWVKQQANNNLKQYGLQLSGDPVLFIRSGKASLKWRVSQYRTTGITVVK